MKKTLTQKLSKAWPRTIAGLLAMVVAPVLAQTSHEVIEDGYEASDTTQAQVYEPMTTAELEELAGPIALYPDDLVSLILPAATYPVQVVQAARFLEDRERDTHRQPPDDWDDAVVALLNYPEVIELMNDDLDWTWALGEAFLNQQAGLLDAIAGFRRQAYAAGNLKSDERQVVTVDHEVIEIEPADPEVIYVPYYEPARVIVYQPYPVYYYHRYPRYSYYYPYPADYSFAFGYFFGVSTAYRLHWHSHRLYTYDYGYRGHPYYGHSYYGHHYFRHRPHRPYRPRHAFSQGRYAGDAQRGDIWRPRHRHGSRPRSAVNTWRSGRHSTSNGKSAGSRELVTRAQRYRQRSKASADRGYVSPYVRTESAAHSKRARPRNVYTDKDARTRQLNSSPRNAPADVASARQPSRFTNRASGSKDTSRAIRDHLRNSRDPRPVDQGPAARIVRGDAAQGARALNPDRRNHRTLPESSRVRSSRPDTRVVLANHNPPQGVSRSSTSGPSAYKRQVASPPLAYRQPQRETPARPVERRTRQAVASRQPVSQGSRQHPAAASRQARQPEARPERAPPRSERPRATGRKAPRRH